MSQQSIPLAETHSFSKTFLAYIAKEAALNKFYGLYPEVDNFKAQMGMKNFPEQHRVILQTTIQNQYLGIPTSERVNEAIQSLTNTSAYTVTTGHQLSIFAGPLYFIYKIITTINTAKTLAKQYPDKTFVPVFWMASEDHDFEEINHFHLFGKDWKWETNQKGAVGRFSLDGMEVLLDSLPEKVALFEKAYRAQTTLAAATRYFVNELFGDEGLVVVDGDDSSLKRLFIPIIKDEIKNKQSHSKVVETSEALTEAGYAPQIHAREINLFYLDDSLRERILEENGVYKVNNTNLIFSEKELLELIDVSPEKFSPNVVLRPLYQESILPNLTYIGGPAEVVYWLQLKAVFDCYQLPFPILMPRNFALYVNKGNFSKITKLGISVEELFHPEEKLKKEFLAKISEVDFSFEAEQTSLKNVFEGLKSKVGSVDKSLEPTVLADLQKTLKLIEEIEKKVKKAVERKNETSVSQVMALKHKLFPEGGLQERKENFLNFYINNPNFITQLIQEFDSFDFSFSVLIENE